MMSLKDSRVSDGIHGTFPVVHAKYEIRRARGGSVSPGGRWTKMKKELCCRVSVLRNQLRYVPSLPSNCGKFVIPIRSFSCYVVVKITGHPVSCFPLYFRGKRVISIALARKVFYPNRCIGPLEIADAVLNTRHMNPVN